MQIPVTGWIAALSYGNTVDSERDCFWFPTYPEAIAWCNTRKDELLKLGYEVSLFMIYPCGDLMVFNLFSLPKKG